MYPRDFCYWLQSILEIRQVTTLTPEQAKEVNDHLNLVMRNLDSNAPANMLLGTAFCQRLSGTFDAIDLSKGISKAMLAKIQSNLSTAFSDEIDTTFANRAELHSLHTATSTFAPDDQDPDDGPQEVAMC